MTIIWRKEKIYCLESRKTPNTEKLIYSLQLPHEAATIDIPILQEEKKWIFEVLKYVIYWGIFMNLECVLGFI